MFACKEIPMVNNRQEEQIALTFKLFRYFVIKCFQNLFFFNVLHCPLGNWARTSAWLVLLPEILLKWKQTLAKQWKSNMDKHVTCSGPRWLMMQPRSRYPGTRLLKTAFRGSQMKDGLKVVLFSFLFAFSLFFLVHIIFDSLLVAMKRSWDRKELICCQCSELSYLHVHCPCSSCNG